MEKKAWARPSSPPPPRKRGRNGRQGLGGDPPPGEAEAVQNVGGDERHHEQAKEGVVDPEWQVQRPLGEPSAQREPGKEHGDRYGSEGRPARDQGRDDAVEPEISVVAVVPRDLVHAWDGSERLVPGQTGEGPTQEEDHQAQGHGGEASVASCNRVLAEGPDPISERRLREEKVEEYRCAEW